ncbi:LysR family transcriptional regulator [Oceanospirillum sediminis]|uniref:LysR family transcriptional regulator n=1 Tax=Oceanospirillum sediminis TaxID=2760088 RepID=A0A839INI6_9GAMM|nr:LysR family transcriptional regulator [Oceanospirillum sediminis]MBB1486260.1 LysR family transcriptional regulator [Oceanospirillum sediminis]
MLEQISSLNHLRTFTLAARYLSFKDAATALNISPAAVSHQIKALESQLRLSLFERHTRAISLTAAGAKLAEACETHFSQLDYVLSELRQPRTDINISCCNSFAALWLTPRSGQINDAFPANGLKTCASDSLVDLTRDKHIDLALRYGRDEKMDDETLLCTEKIALYRTPGFMPDTNKKPVLFVTEWPENELLGNIDWRSEIDISHYTVRTFQQEYFVLQAIMTGQGYGLLSNVLSASAVEQGWIVRDHSFTPFNGYSYWMRLNPERKDIGLIQRFSHWLTQEFSQYRVQGLL